MQSGDNFILAKRECYTTHQMTIVTASRILELLIGSVNMLICFKYFNFDTLYLMRLMFKFVKVRPP